MRAVVAEQPGPPGVLRAVELADPLAGRGQVVVDVAIAGITFIETQMRAGTSPRSPGPFPLVLGNGVGGVVSSVGSDVDLGWIGQTVVTGTGGTGGYATRVVAAVSDLHRPPDGLELQTAVALLADGRTALALTDAAVIRAGDVVAVTAAGGGVGSLIVQLATRAGARVVALAGEPAKLDVARRLGAEVTVDYRADDWPALLDSALPGGFDVVFDGVGGETSGVLSHRLRTGARYVVHGAASGQFGGVSDAVVTERNVTVIALWSIASSPQAMFDLVERAFALAVDGAIEPTVGQWFPLDRAADAHSAIEARRTIGKTLLIV